MCPYVYAKLSVGERKFKEIDSFTRFTLRNRFFMLSVLCESKHGSNYETTESNFLNKDPIRRREQDKLLLRKLRKHK